MSELERLEAELSKVDNRLAQLRQEIATSEKIKTDLTYLRNKARRLERERNTGLGSSQP